VIVDMAMKTGMGALLAISVPVGGDGAMWAQWGLAGLVVGYVLWRDWLREKRMSEAIERDHKWVRETLLSALEKSTAALLASKEGSHAGDGSADR